MLVVLRSALKASKNNTHFLANHFYRFIEENGTYIVYGELFTKVEFDSLFELAKDKVLRDFKEIGILTDKNKPISESLFAYQANIVGYGKLNIWIFRNSRELIYGFYPMQGTRKEQLAECYAWYLELVNGDLTSLDNTDVCFGNCGIPLVYGNLRVS